MDILTTTIRRFRDQEYHPQHQDPKEDGTNAERPPIAIILDDVARHQRPSRYPRQQKQIPHRDAGRSFMDEVQIPDRALHEDFVGGHPNPGDDPRGEKAIVFRGGGAPDGGREHDRDGDDVDGAFAVDLG